MKRIIFLFVLLSVFSSSALAQRGSLDQYRAEIGLTAGSSFYIGDANPTLLFNRAGLSFGGLARYNMSPRFALKASLKKATVAGDTRDYPNKYPFDQFAAFEKSFWDLGVNLEFNFIDYGLPAYVNGSSFFSPYIFIGAGFTSSHDDRNNVPQVDFNFPYGLGAKFKLYERLNVGFEWSLHTLFVDDFDVVDENSIILNNPYGVQGIGNKNKDKYSIASVFISLDLFKHRYCK